MVRRKKWGEQLEIEEPTEEELGEEHAGLLSGTEDEEASYYSGIERVG